MDYHQNARLTVHSREQLARRVLEQPEDGGQVGSPISRAGAGGSRRPVVAPAPLPTHHFFSFIGKGFGSSSAALQRLVDRPRGGYEPSHRQPYPAPSRHEPAAFA
jgi:hypothetical protein